MSVVACGVLVVAAWGSAAVGAVQAAQAWAGALRVGCVICSFAVARLICAHDARAARALAWVAVWILAAHAIMLALGLYYESVAQVVFDRTGRHAVTGSLPRFRGLTPQPMACGSALLLTCGHLFALRSRSFRWLTLSVAVGVISATLSVAALVLPLAGCAHLRSAAWRRAASGALILFVLGILWITPLRLSVLGRVWYETAPVASYYEDDMGPRYQPFQSLDFGAAEFTFYPTVYQRLGVRAVQCLLEHPLGVGAGNFEEQCPTWAVNTVGTWLLHRAPNNVYGELLAEGGLFATLASAALWALWLRQYRGRADARGQRGVIWAYLLAGLGGASPHQFGFATLLASCSERRGGREPARDA
jgi:hypothetical protein